MSIANDEEIILWMFHVHIRDAGGRIHRHPVMSMGATEEQAKNRLTLVIPRQIQPGEHFIKVERYLDNSLLVDDRKQPILSASIPLEHAHAELGHIHGSAFTNSDPRWWARKRG